MNCYCDFCDKTNKHKSGNNHLESISHIQYEKCFRINRANKNQKIFDLYKNFIDYIANHNKKFGSYLVKSDFILFFTKIFYLISKQIFIIIL